MTRRKVCFFIVLDYLEKIKILLKKIEGADALKHIHLNDAESKMANEYGNFVIEFSNNNTFDIKNK